MSEDFELIRGTGNVFRDLDREDADAEQLKALLAAQIIACLDRRHLTGQAAREATGIATADFSRIRRAKLDRFTVDRLMSILNRLGQQVDVSVTLRERPAA
ncbi:helix-turn-helix transcriptional regulator [Methylorubrum populi]|jgi:predicted XRE-type DNA-binding protein|uniref:HigA2-like helix-turn-helix domain-containing protein n=2 Tax=Methylorubrum TaxID=2282523 RepID=B1ZA25_METPB|nr:MULTISPECIES: helix-turn-helix transcriptional regulator [Methylorubrum]ACB79174.1 conserved hypothetical protein [Methylorubrum populi BJ001]MBA8914250.1 putative XRE-type DNA-binding protein [Methylorubrum thiocyanatum]OAH27574.1 XRE family transcriptional regulator [Methylorubrum populi]PZP66670.1 MAG: XRE family transcriptional regulator [Methylorubrum populi]GJE82518.1 hypothetical protein CJNNKLLH_3884 [Methylorubrum thiocyanatum]